MAGRLEGVRAVVTGASRGIGRAVARAYAAEGARLVLTATRPAGLDGALAECREAGAEEAHGLELDLGDPRSVDAAAARAVALLGRVDVLVNNAGVLGPKGPLAEVPPDGVAEAVQVGLIGTVRLTQRILPAMSGDAAIIMVSSGASGRPGWAGYALAKAGLDAAAAMLRDELAGRVRVVAVNPGQARTAMRAEAYPAEDPATVPHPSALTAPFVAIAEGADPGPRVEAREWR